MLFRSKDLDAIFAGGRSLAFRRWKRPTAKAGGQIRTARGMVGIDSVEPIEPAEVTDTEAREAGYVDAAGVRAMFDAQEGQCYRIRLHAAGPDPGDTLRPMKSNRSSSASPGSTVMRLGPCRCSS